MNELLEKVLADLAAEGDHLERVVSRLDNDGWRTPTPAPGWDVAHQVAHLAWTDEVALAAATDKDAWDAVVTAALTSPDPERYVDAMAADGASDHPGDLLARWQTGRRALVEALRTYPAKQKMPWFGPPMSSTSMATARFMETWAHGLDVVEGLGLGYAPSDRIVNVAELGIRTRDFAFATHGLTPPAEPFGVTLVSPGDDIWTWGPPDAAQTVTGSAYDFCLLVTQRRHRADLDLQAVGADADRWLDIAQAFAGPPGEGQVADVIRIANCSGFYGDRLTAMREVLDGGPGAERVDYVTGDYLAELTMLILGRDQLKDPSLGYAKTFVRQLEDCLGDALERGVKIVSNAGGLNPAGLAERIREVAHGLGLDPVVAHVEGDNLASRAAELGFDGALTANAYLGGFGIAEALTRGADVVVTGRVTDASVVVGPGIAAFGWTPTSYDELAGAVVAGHVIECGTQATGGNFSGFLDLPRDATPLGFPIAELAADGSSVITKHAGTGGAVTIDTVTAQLMYEVQSTTYLNPDVSVDLTSIRLSDDGPDRVRIGDVRGSAPPERLKVATNTLGGYRNQMEFVLTGLDVEAKAAWVREQLEAALDPRPAVVAWSQSRRPDGAGWDADTQEGASCLLRVVVQDASADVVGRGFSGAAVALALASYPGFTMTSPPGAASPYGIYRAAYVDRDEVTEKVVVP